MLYGREMGYIKMITEIMNNVLETQEMTTAEIEKLGLYVEALHIERKVQALEESNTGIKLMVNGKPLVKK